MTNKEKVISAFLVSMGIFSVTQAVNYISSLSAEEKEVVFSAAQMKDSNVFLCTTSTFPQDMETNPISRA